MRCSPPRHRALQKRKSTSQGVTQLNSERPEPSIHTQGKILDWEYCKVPSEGASRQETFQPQTTQPNREGESRNSLVHPASSGCIRLLSQSRCFESKRQDFSEPYRSRVQILRKSRLRGHVG